MYLIKHGLLDLINDLKVDNYNIFSAYIKLDHIKIINEVKSIKQIVVRWEIEDLCKGVSDLELYHYCKENDIILYRNTRLHMKAIWDNENTLLFGSSNITAAGLGMSENYNYELNGICECMTLDDKKYLYEVISCSELVTDTLYEEIKALVESVEMPVVDYPQLPTKKKAIDSFLLSQLPMSLSPENLYEASHSPDKFNDLEISCAAHDLAIYGIDPYQEFSMFLADLNSAFNGHPFIVSLKVHIKSQPNQSLRYGGVVNWIQNNTTTVPTPRSWEIKKDQIVNILYQWICYFDKDFSWDKPNISQVIKYRKYNL